MLNIPIVSFTSNIALSGISWFGNDFGPYIHHMADPLRVVMRPLDITRASQ